MPTLNPTIEDVYNAVDRIPSSAAVVGFTVVSNLTGVRPVNEKYESIPAALKRHGLAVSKVQKHLDTLEAEGRVVKVHWGAQKGYVTDVAADEAEAKFAAKLAANRPNVARREATRIVLERHAAEIEALVTELLAKES
jgi:hypothetical protein